MTEDLLTPDHLIALRRLGGQGIRNGHVAERPGGIVTRRRGPGLEVADVAPYGPGDDPRHLDRAATARTGRMHVRRYHAEHEALTLLVADLRPAMLWGTGRCLRSVSACEALALVGWQAVAAGGRVGCFAATGSGVVHAPFRGGDRGMIRAIGALLRAHRQAVDHGLGDDPPLAGLLAGVPRVCPKGTQVVLASAFDTAGELDPALDAMARRGTLRLVRIEDAASSMPTGRYPVRLADGRRISLARGASVDPLPGRPVERVDSAGDLPLHLLAPAVSRGAA